MNFLSEFVNKIKGTFSQYYAINTRRKNSCQYQIQCFGSLIQVNLSMNLHMHEWIFDSGASFYVTLNKLWFNNWHESDHGHVIAQGGVVYKITGVVV